MPKSELHAAWGARIRELREEKRLSQRALGAEIGIGGSAIHRLEIGEFAPTDEVRVNLSRALGVRVETLFAYPDTTVPDESAAAS